MGIAAEVKVQSAFAQILLRRHFRLFNTIDAQRSFFNLSAWGEIRKVALGLAASARHSRLIRMHASR
jgi:hypothetical protein